MLTQEQLKRTPLFEEHLKLNAKMVPFGGWDMPVQYEGILSEYQATRQEAAMFDICHMGEFIIEGDLKETGLDRIVTMSLADLPVKTSRYGFICNERGGTIDDTIIFRMAEKKWFIVVNASTTPKDAAQFLKNLKQPKSFQDVSAITGKIDLQGPKSRDVLRTFVPSIDKLNYFSFDEFELLGENVLISRTGYTGELGYEIFYPANKVAVLWQALLKTNQVTAAGLGARDLLRLEMGYSLYGHELEENISPLEAGLERFIDFNKDFIGKESLLEQKNNGIKRKLIGFVADSRRSPRAEQKILSSDEKVVGQVSSGCFSPELNRGIGLGFVTLEHAKLTEKIFFGDDKNKNPAIITGKSFYKRSSIKNGSTRSACSP